MQRLLFALILISICSAHSVSAQEKKQISFAIAPFSLLHRNLKTALEVRFGQGRHALSVNPNYFFGYHHEELPYLFSGDEVKHMDGFGIEGMHKLYLKKLSDQTRFSWRLFGAYGGGLQWYRVEYDAYSYYPIEEDGIPLYTYGLKENREEVVRYSGSVELGIQKRSGRLLFEASGGLKYQVAQTEVQYLNDWKFDYSIVQIGYSGWIPRAGVKIGFFLF